MNSGLMNTVRSSVLICLNIEKNHMLLLFNPIFHAAAKHGKAYRLVKYKISQASTCILVSVGVHHLDYLWHIFFALPLVPLVLLFPYMRDASMYRERCYCMVHSSPWPSASTDSFNLNILDPLPCHTPARSLNFLIKVLLDYI